MPRAIVSCIAILAASGASFGASVGGLVEETPVRTALPSSDLWRSPGVALCFAPGTDEAYANAFWQWFLSQQNGGERFFNGERWTPQNLGEPRTVTYSFPNDTLGGIGGGATSQNVLNQRLVQWYGSVANGHAKFRQVFDRWEALAGVGYTQINDDNSQWGNPGSGGRGDIRIVSINIDGGGGVLAFNSFPQNGDMVIDSSESYQSATNDFRFFRNVVAHENGHGMGLFHSCPQNATKLMEPGLNTNFDGPQHDDIRGFVFLYGDPYESNNSAGTAINLGNVGAPRQFDGAAISTNADVDFYRITMPTAGDLSVTIDPVGLVYFNGPQSDGCPQGQQINTNDDMNLSFELLAADGVTVLATADSAAAGQNEILASFPIATGGNYLIRVYPVNAPLLEVQLYNIIVSAELAGCPGDTNGDNEVNFEDLNIVLFNYGLIGQGILGDLDGDGDVDFGDLNLVLSNYNLVC